MRGRDGIPIAQKVLHTLFNAAQAFASEPASNFRAYRVLRKFETLEKLSNKQLRATSHYLLSKKYIAIRRARGKKIIEITPRGKRVVEIASIRLLKPKKQVIWDNKWRLVLFDIPERLKPKRDSFAAMLKRLGFVTLQKSAFLCPYPCEKELGAVARYYDITEHVAILITERFEGDRQFLKVFDL